MRDTPTRLQIAEQQIVDFSLSRAWEDTTFSDPRYRSLRFASDTTMPDCESPTVNVRSISVIS
jgi:hypothetical protein